MFKATKENNQNFLVIIPVVSNDNYVSVINF